MRKIFRSLLCSFTAFFLIFLCSCNENETISVNATANESTITVSQTAVVTADFVNSASFSTTVNTSEVTNQTAGDELEEIEVLEEIEELDTILDIVPEIPIRYQNGIELCTEDSNFQISETSIKNLNSIYKSYPKTAIAWGLYSLKDGSYISLNKDTEFTSCSTIKVVYALFCLEQVKQGQASLDDILYYDKTKHHYWSKTASSSTIYKLDRSKFTLKEVIYYSLYVSDNDAYLLLQSTFGFDAFNQYVKDLGSTTELTSTMRYGHATVSSRAKEWKQIYSFYNEETDISEFFKETLLDAKYGYIEEGLSTLGYDTAHKSGWSNQYGAAHDCAIVYSPDGEYLMIILTQKYGSKPQTGLIKNLAPILNQIWSEYSSSR